jgi:hypothetical protein
MKASTSYDDLIGTSAADISDVTTRGNSLEQLAEYFKIDQNRLKVVGISIYGTQGFFLSFICVDKEKSTSEKEHIVKVMINADYENVLPILFKRFQTILYKRGDSHYSELGIDEESELFEFQTVE